MQKSSVARALVAHHEIRPIVRNCSPVCSARLSAMAASLQLQSDRPGVGLPVERLRDPANLENLRIVLVRTRNPLNIGAAARAMSNFGAFHLRVVTPYEKAFREAVSAVGAAPL